MGRDSVNQPPKIGNSLKVLTGQCIHLFPTYGNLQHHEGHPPHSGVLKSDSNNIFYLCSHFFKDEALRFLIICIAVSSFDLSLNYLVNTHQTQDSWVPWSKAKRRDTAPERE